MNQHIVHNELFAVILVMNQMKKKRKEIILKFIILNYLLLSYRTLTTEHNSNSNDSVDDVLEKNTDKRPQYRNIMNNIRRGIRTDDDGTNNKRV